MLIVGFDNLIILFDLTGTSFIRNNTEKSQSNKGKDKTIQDHIYETMTYFVPGVHNVPICETTFIE